MPAVKTNASSPPRAAASMPASSPGAVDEIFECERGFRIGTFFEFANVIAHPRKPFQTGLTVEKVLDCRGAHTFLRKKIEHNAGIELAGPRSHWQPVKRSKSHGALDTAAIGQRAH